jgi:hypothetical protein
MSRMELHYFLFIGLKGIYNYKLCLHSFLALAPRVKQPALHIQAYITSQAEERIISINRSSNKTLTTMGCGTRPVSIGSRRRRAE